MVVPKIATTSVSASPDELESAARSAPDATAGQSIFTVKTTPT